MTDHVINRDGESLFVTAQDGLRLHVRRYGAANAPGLPIVCLPGLARTAEDFVALAKTLAADTAAPRRVFALDYRGRGQSGYDRDPANYNFTVELADILAVLSALDIGRAVFVGTSRGGLLTMLLAAARPGAIAGAVLNDIGPAIEPKGLMRIKGYVGKLPEPQTFEEGAEILRRLFDMQFPKLTAEDWQAFARRSWTEQKGRLRPTYDVRLAATLKGVEMSRPLPPLWNEFDALAQIPLLVVRGANSDILSPETVEAMRQRRQPTGGLAMETLEVSDQGHAPLLVEPEIIARIGDFARRCAIA
jgi:pimeloyl-ACP methyl ester carboxylesterase